MGEWISDLLYDLKDALTDEFNAIRDEKVLGILNLSEEWFETEEEEDIEE